LLIFFALLFALPGPVLASAGPDWKLFCRAPLSGVCRNFWEEASSDNIEIMDYVKVRGPKRVMPS